ncbi:MULTISPECIES: sporulation peptidase YabG [unclassified Paenibacillus]|uniref:Sporulation peptidase YabG n=1 Tax=Paenibacillus provencensis TaxID=441151 RepID=A0ABW3Q1H8_9BACL|nr:MULTISPECIES: sporulation peptidase YabG [unclassified Paenibacillus]MCM3130753.1 sporulation peptidase YabG [Paenibacillus sp. MER 78]SFS94825.1 spore coat assemly protein [Paenibacillus sp. 453mf]
MNIGDLVVRKSYGGDITFRVEGLKENKAYIKGTEFRLFADSPLNDLIRVPYEPETNKTRLAHIKANESYSLLQKHRLEQAQRNQAGLVDEWNKNTQTESPSFFEMPGKVLHLDGDPNYLKKSMALYDRLRVPAEGHYVHEASMADTLYRLLPRSRPDIVVITGHDGVLKGRQPYDLYNINHYKNSSNFIAAVQVARQYEWHLDALTIVAGACQSHFEALIRAGANFASSPSRVLIHALDPVYVAAKAAFTSVKDTININDIIHHTISGSEGVGGLESRGSYRIGLPPLQDLSTLKVSPAAI